MKIEAGFTYERVRYDLPKDVHLVVRMRAPAIAWEKTRPPVCVVPILDVSGSMGGDKLLYAKRTLLKLADHLRPGDYLGFGGFSTDVVPYQAPVEVAQASRDAFRAKVGEVAALATTNFSGGIELGLRWAREVDFPAGGLVRVIMLTDGLANVGVTSKEGLQKIVEGRGRATVSFFGYGKDADQALLADLARVGEGSYAFVQNPDDALTAFGKELGGLLSTYAENVTIDLAPHGNHQIAEVLSDADVEERPGKGPGRDVDGLPKVLVHLGSLLAEEERSLVVRVRLAKQSQPLPREVSVVDVRVTYDVLEGAKRERREESLKARVRFVKKGEEQEKAAPDLDRIVAMAEVAKVQVEAEEKAKAGNYQAAQALFANAGQALAARGVEDVAEFVESVGARYASAATYRSSEGYRVSANRAVRRAVAVASVDADLAMDWQASVGDALGTSAQASTARSFEDGASSVVVVDPGPVVSGSAPLFSTESKPAKLAKAKVSTKRGPAKSKSGRW